ncbi:putative C69 family dipeptidase [Blattamonas nauphoetae]|uniref:C69 family dipeptidase n=1 Tax=Blattamonas nauphoetae TaxID=2049346 RepID=A0ABQ9YHU4_9EUKA|nr:putative C69 family dipeptidase [Blattamonas nauphoetae]
MRALLFIWLCAHVFGCTNLIATKGATSTGRNMFSYCADSFKINGHLYHHVGGTHPEGTKRKIIDWDTNTEIGEIDEAPETYTVVGNMNEFGLTIGETTWGGLAPYNQKNGLIDYGSLLWIALERTKTARDAIAKMVEIVTIHGYYSSGETFTIADQNEVWIMEMIGRGPDIRGVYWVAVKLPDNAICAHSNHARLEKLSKYRDTEILHDHKLFEELKEAGIYDGPEDDFGFAATFDGTGFGKQRSCDARSWAYFKAVLGDTMDQYENYIMGKPNTERFPLYYELPADKDKITPEFLMNMMGSHFENTVLNGTWNVGSFPNRRPGRIHPLTWEYEGKTYTNERTISTQQTVWSFVAEIRKEDEPNQEQLGGGIFWFGFDEAEASVLIPFLPVNQRVHPSYTAETGNQSVFSYDNQYWVNSLMTNFMHSFYDVLQPEVLKLKSKYHDQYVQDLALLEEQASKMTKDEAREHITATQEQWGGDLTKNWLNEFTSLFTVYFDGMKRYTDKDTPKYYTKTQECPYDQGFYDLIAKEDTEGKYLVHDNPPDPVVPTLEAHTEL